MKIPMQQLEDSKWESAQTSVDLTPYTSVSNSYEVPTDGYLTITNPAGNAFVRVSDVSTYFSFSGAANPSIGTTTSFFVRKGMKLFVHTMVTGATVAFRALKPY